MTITLQPRTETLLQMQAQRLGQDADVVADALLRAVLENGFVTYENRASKHVTIHISECRQIAKRGGHHAYGQGGYHVHIGYDAARRYAEETKLPVNECSFCKPSD